MNVQNERLNTRAALLNLLTAILWGGNSVSIKLGLSGIPPLCLAGMRFLLGGLVVYIWTRPLKIDLKTQIQRETRHCRPHLYFSRANLPAQCGNRLHPRQPLDHLYLGLPLLHRCVCPPLYTGRQNQHAQNDRHGTVFSRRNTHLCRKPITRRTFNIFWATPSYSQVPLCSALARSISNV